MTSTGLRQMAASRGNSSLLIPIRDSKTSTSKKSAEQIVQVIGRLAAAPESAEVQALNQKVQGGETLKAAFRQLPAEQQAGLEGKIGEKNLNELLSLSGEPNAAVFQHSLLQFANRLKENSEIEKAAAIFNLLSEAGLVSISPEIQARAKREFEAMTGAGAIGPRAAFLLERVSEDSSDAKTFAPIVLASLAGNFVGTGSLGKLLSLGGETWYSRSLGARFAAGFAGYGAEFLTFGLAGHALNPHPGPLSDDLWSSAITIAAFKGTNFLGNQLFLKTHSLNEFGLPTRLSGMARFNQVAVPQFAMFTGMLAAHRLEEMAGLRKPTDNATLVTDTLFSMFTLGLGMHNVNRALGPGWRGLQLELGARTEDFAKISNSSRPSLSETTRLWFSSFGNDSSWKPAAAGVEGFSHPMQMSGFSEGGGGGRSKSDPPPSSDPISDSGARYIRPKSYEIQQVEREFGNKLLEELFGKEKSVAAMYLASLFVNRPGLREKYPAVDFSQADLLGRKKLLRKLAGDSHSDKVEHEQKLGKTRVQTGLFNEAMGLMVAFTEHNKEALDALTTKVPPPEAPNPNAIVLVQPTGGLAKAGPPPAPSGLPQISVAGDPLTLIPNAWGQLVLGRNEFFGDSTVSVQHLALVYQMGSWGILDGKSTFGTYHYDPARKTWDALRNDQYQALTDGELFHIGNTYYRSKVWGSTVDFEPVRLPDGVPANNIKRYTSITIGNQSYRVTLYTTGWGTEKGHLRLGDLLFQFERGQWNISDLGVIDGVNHNGLLIPRASNPIHPDQINPEIRTPLTKGDKIQFQDQIFLVQSSKDEGLSLFQQSIWSETPLSRRKPEPVAPPESRVPASEAARNSDPPQITLDSLKMNSARSIYFGNTGKSTGLTPVPGSNNTWSLSLERKPLFGGKEWALVEYNDLHETFRVKNLQLGGKNELVAIRQGSGNQVHIGLDQSEYLQVGDKIFVMGHGFILTP